MAQLNKDYMLVKISNKRSRVQTSIRDQLSSFNEHTTDFVNGFNLDEIKDFFNKNKEVTEIRRIRAGVVGHWMTSYNIYKYLVTNNIEQLLILEDDAILSKTFVEDLEKCIKELPDNFEFFTAYQNVYTMYNCTLPKLKVMSKMPIRYQPKPEKDYIHSDWDVHSNLVVRTYQKQGTVAYIITKSGAEKMIDHIIKNGFGKSRTYSTTIEEPLYLKSMNDEMLGYQLNPYAKIDSLVTIEKTVKGTDTESQIRNTPYLYLSELGGDNA